MAAKEVGKADFGCDRPDHPPFSDGVRIDRLSKGARSICSSRPMQEHHPRGGECRWRTRRVEQMRLCLSSMTTRCAQLIAQPLEARVGGGQTTAAEGLAKVSAEGQDLVIINFIIQGCSTR